MFVLSKQSALAAASTSLFVLLWSSGAIFSKWGLAHASPFAFLLIRFAIALCGLVLLVPLLKLKLPRGGKPMLYAMATGVVLLGAYQIFYLLALDLKVTPGMMATIMGVQPILTVVIMERQRSASRLFGLALGLVGLIMVVYQGIGMSGMSLAGMLFGLLALASMTFGSIMQKRITDNPLGNFSLSSGANSRSPHRAITKRISRKANGEACARPHLEKIAPLLHSSTNRLVDASASADFFERTNMNTTCSQARSQLSRS